MSHAQESLAFSSFVYDPQRCEQAEAERRVKTKGELGIKVGRAVASKLRAPDTDLVRLDLQRWPKNFLHTKGS